MVEVIQADREAAAKALGYADWEDATDYRLSGRRDRERDSLVQAFARHRIEAAAQARREALEEAAAEADSIGEAYGEDETGWFECSETIARAIRSLSDSPPHEQEG